MRAKSAPLLTSVLLALLSSATLATTPHKAIAPKSATPKPAPAPAPAAVPKAPPRDVLEILYLNQTQAAPSNASSLEEPAREIGLQGARLAIVDNNTTGQFTRQQFQLKEINVAEDSAVLAAYQQAATTGAQFVVANLSAAALLKLADAPEAADDLIFNIAATDDALRNEQCRANLLHPLPSRAMRADALAQYLLSKRWKHWLLVIGPSEADRLLAEAYRRAAKRYGGKIVEERPWSYDYDERRTAQSTIATFTQGVEYDVLVVADEANAFGDYLAYRTWLPRPIVGTHGLTPMAWSPMHEQWGAIQLQHRFRAQAGRVMNDVDYAGWLAVRALGEAATRAKSVAFAPLRDYLRSPAFALAGFKGKPLSLRPWDGQMRQPILLADPRSVIAAPPLDGFLHPQNELDTLGNDAPDSRCSTKPPGH